MLLGAEFQVHTDHTKNFNIGDSSQQGLCWISYVDEYGPELHYVEGPRNVIAVTFSRLLCNDEISPLVGKKAANVINNSKSDSDNESLYSSIIDDKEILNCLLSLSCISSNKKQKKRHAKTEKQISEKHCQRRRQEPWWHNIVRITVIITMTLLSNVTLTSLNTWLTTTL